MAPGVRTLVGVSTSLTVFLGRAERGPVGQPVRVSSFAEYEGTFGGLPEDSPMPWSVQDFFLNGGAQAVIIRLFENAGVQDSAKLSEATYLKGLELLDTLDVYNLVCIPSDSFDGRHDIPANVYRAAATRCADERATLLLDPPSSWTQPGDIHPETFSALFGYGQDSDLAPFSALYFPRVRSPDPRRPEVLLTRPPCGLLAGILARTDTTRGVWKPPAGQETGLVGITDLACTLNDADNARLYAMAVNCLRSFPMTGPIVWGARTLAGVDALGNDFKFLPMRRLTSYLEQTLSRQLRWTVFEPNGEPLWAQLRQAIDAFMNDLFRQGAFQGGSRDEAFFVRCDATTTSPDDIARGIVNIEVGFAPLRPAEFLVLHIEQPAGQRP